MCMFKSLSIDIIDDIYMKLHRINLEEVHKELVGRIVKIEKYTMALKKMYCADRCWRTNRDYVPDESLSNMWNWQRYMSKAIDKYIIKLIGYKHYAMNKIGDRELSYSDNFNIVAELKDGVVSFDLLHEKSLGETDYTYKKTHQYEITNQIRMLAELCLCEITSN